MCLQLSLGRLPVGKVAPESSYLFGGVRAMTAFDVVGVALAVILVLKVEIERCSSERVLAVSLALAAMVYPLLRILGNDGGDVSLEMLVTAGFVALAVSAFSTRSLPTLAAGWLLHAAWDLIAHGASDAWSIRHAYSRLCVAFDLLVLCYLAAASIRNRLRRSKCSTRELAEVHVPK